MARLYFDHDASVGGLTLRLMEKPLIGKAHSVPVNHWADRMADHAFSGVSRISALLDDDKSPVKPKDDGLFVDHLTVASFTESQALGLGLPPSVRFALQVETKNLITDSNFHVAARWIGLANRPLRAERHGALLLVDGREYRLPERFFSLCEAIDTFSKAETTDYDSRMARLAHLQSLIPKDAQDQLALDPYFASFRIMHASAFSLRSQSWTEF